MFLFQRIYICNNINIHIVCVDDTHSADRSSPYVCENLFFQCVIIQTIWFVFGLCSPLKISSKCGYYCLECGWLLAARYLCTQVLQRRSPAPTVTPKWIAQISSWGLTEAFVGGKEIERSQSFSGITYWGIRGFGIVF